MLKAVVFDLDGTLLDTIPDIAGALNGALEENGLPTHPVRAFEGFVGGGIRQAVIQAAPEGTDEEMIDRVLTAYRRRYVAHCMDLTDYYPGIREMLRGLAERGLTLGVLSNKTESSVQAIIAHYFPEIPFRCAFGRVEGRPLKPDPGAAAPVLETLSLPAGEIAYVGDSGTDMTFAIAAGMVPVAAPWGYRSREQLIGCGAALVPDTPGEMLEKLTELAEK